MILLIFFDSELLERVFLRIGSAQSDEQLENVLNRFLPPVLLKLSSQNDTVRKKVSSSFQCLKVSWWRSWCDNLKLSVSVSSVTFILSCKKCNTKSRYVIDCIRPFLFCCSLSPPSSLLVFRLSICSPSSFLPTYHPPSPYVNRTLSPHYSHHSLITLCITSASKLPFKPEDSISNFLFILFISWGRSWNYLCTSTGD